MTKQERYFNLVNDRKNCRQCRGTDKKGLLNPAECNKDHDSNHIGPWSRWQGNLDAKILVVGQDWGDVKYYEDNHGFDKTNSKSDNHYENPTNQTLRVLLKIIDVEIDPAEKQETIGECFFTNAILCLKQNGGLQGTVINRWFINCGHFLKDTIEIVSPKVVIAIGERAFRSVCQSFDIMAPKAFQAAVDNINGFTLSPNGTRLFPVYHCGRRILNTHRKMPAQENDWERIKASLL